jgi:putative salt-induced outer membrane protein YdiY
MTTRSLSLLLSAVALPLCADQVVLSNGDVITGAIIQKDGAMLTMHSESLSDISIPWAAVKTLRSDEDLTVVLPGGESVKGKVSTTDQTLTVGGRSAPLAAVAAIRNAAEQQKWEKLQHPSLGELWVGNFAFGLALVRGNARTETLTNDFTAARVTPHDKIALHFNQIYGRALADNVDTTIASAVRGGWAYNRDFKTRAFISAANDYEHDRFQSLDLRAVFGGGVGWLAVKTGKTNLGVQAGADYEHEAFMRDVTRNSAEFNFGDDLLYKASAVTSITQSFRMFANLTDTGEYRVNFDLSGVTAIKRWLGWHVTFSDRFLSNPVFGRLRNDLLLSTGLRVTVAGK